jgi:hypothetical protein
MSNASGIPSTANPAGLRDEPATRSRWSETKSAFKTTEFYVWLIVSLAILIASAVVDKGPDGQGFGAAQAWQYVALVTAAYIISRGIAKAGTRRDDRHGDRS